MELLLLLRLFDFGFNWLAMQMQMPKMPSPQIPLLIRPVCPLLLAHLSLRFSPIYPIYPILHPFCWFAGPFSSSDHFWWSFEVFILIYLHKIFMHFALLQSSVSPHVPASVRVCVLFCFFLCWKVDVEATWTSGLSTQHSALGCRQVSFLSASSVDSAAAFQLKIVFHYIWVDWFLIDFNWASLLAKRGRLDVDLGNRSF